MGLLLGSLPMLVLLIWFSLLPDLGAQYTTESSRSSAQALDALLQDYAYRAFVPPRTVRPRTGIPYDGNVPSNLTGIEITAMRLRSGSLRSKGVDMYKEFHIPIGVIVRPYVERLVLVYQNLGNWSMAYYPLTGYTYLTPVLGLLAYDASNLSATNLSELDLKASRDPISIRFSDVKSAPFGSVARCVWIDLSGLVNFSNVLSGNVCSTFQQGHFSIVVESIAPSPAPGGGPPNVGPTPSGGGKRNNNSTVWIIVGSVLGGLVLLSLLVFLVLWVRKYKHRKKMQQMERAAEVGESLKMATVGDTKAPSASVTRTPPILETEYVA